MPPTDLDEGTIRRIDWQELCPAVLLPQSVSIATTFRVLWVASFGVLLSLFLGFVLNVQVTKDRFEIRKDQLEKAKISTGIPKISTEILSADDFHHDVMEADAKMQRDFIRFDEMTKAIPKTSVVDLGDNNIPLPTPSTLLLPWRMMSDSLYRSF